MFLEAISKLKINLEKSESIFVRGLSNMEELIGVWGFRVGPSTRVAGVKSGIAKRSFQMLSIN